MEFLDGSQTFLGVLLTFNVLCLFAEKDSNFIFRALQKLKDAFKADLGRLQKVIDSEKIEFKNNPDYKKVEEISSSNDKYGDENSAKAYQLLYNHSLKQEDSTIWLTKGYVELDKIDKSNEQFRAPLFTLLYGIVIFLTDEVCRWINSISFFEACKIFTWIFTILSLLYWSLVWGVFFYRKNEGSNEKNRILKFIDRWCKVFFGSVIKIAFCCALFYGIMMLWPWGISSQSIRTAIIVVSAIVPIFLIGLWREKNCTCKGNYSFKHVCGHMSAFVLYSIILTFIALKCYYGPISMIGFLNDVGLLRVVIIVFVLMNGMMVPFILPYKKYSRLYSESKEKLDTLLEKIIKSNKEFEKDFGEFCKDIVKADSMTFKKESKQTITRNGGYKAILDEKTVMTRHCEAYEKNMGEINMVQYCINNNIEIKKFIKAWNIFQRNKGM